MKISKPSRNVTTASRKPADFRVETLTAGRKDLTVIYQRRWALQVMTLLKGVKVRVFRNGRSICEEHGVLVNCSHVKELKKVCETYNLWS